MQGLIVERHVLIDTPEACASAPPAGPFRATPLPRFPAKACTSRAMPACSAAPRSTRRSTAATGREVWRRWAAQTPPDFRFAAKLPRSISHDARLRGAREPLRRFLDEAGGLGDRLAVLLVQLPPSFAFESRAGARLLRRCCAEMFERRGRLRAAPSELVRRRRPIGCSPRRACRASPPTRRRCPRRRSPAAGSGRTATAAAPWSTTAGTARRASTGRAMTRRGSRARRASWSAGPPAPSLVHLRQHRRRRGDLERARAARSHAREETVDA